MRPATSIRLSLVLVATAALAACEAKAPAPTAAPPAAAPAPVDAPTPEPAPPVLGRAELLRALEAAASIYAAGQPAAGEDLKGRRFLLRQAFGCPGADDAAKRAPGLAGWSWGRRDGTIEVSLTPADWTTAPAIQGAGDPWEAVEGYWLNRPWLRTEGCPAGAPAAEESRGEDPREGAEDAVAADQTAGLAAVFLHDGSRLLRRDGKAFRHTVRGEDGAAPPQGGYRLVLEGRLAAFPQTGVIRCRATGPDARPVCIAAAEIDRVAFEAADGAVLSEWRQGG